MRTPFKLRRIFPIAAMLIIGFAFVPSVRAEKLVTFTRGQSIVVQSAEKRGAWYYFVLEGGGELGVPAGRVARIEEYEAPPPASDPAAIVQAPAPSAPAPAGSPAATGQREGPQGVQPAPRANAAGAEESPTNVAAPGTEDWRYKVRMSGGPRSGEARRFGPAAGAGARPPFAGGRRFPGGNQFQNAYPRRPPAGQQEQQEQPPQQ